MISEEYFQKELQQIIENAIREDVGVADYSALACVPDDAIGRAKLLVKQDGIIAGVEFAKKIFEYVDSQMRIDVFIQDGEPVKYGDVVFHVFGKSQSILKAERTVLNAMQRMSAIATKTNYLKNIIKDTQTQILDTRKTTPGIRAIEKWAVKIGGGENHRFGLFDMIMLKDNHIDYTGGVEEAILKTHKYLKDNNLDLKVIVEARNLDEVKQILNVGRVYRILLDNFTVEQTKEAVAFIAGKTLTESSGNINEHTILDYAKTGVNFVSIGALTHSVYNMDLSLKAF